MTYYQQLKTVFEKHVNAYKEDFTKHDRDSLKSYHGAILWGCRESGTDLIKLTGEWRELDFEWAEAFLFKGSNSHFQYGEHGKVRAVSRDKALQIWKDFKRHVTLAQKLAVA